MNLINLFKRRASQEDQKVLIEPDELPEPGTLDEFMRRGWAYHSRKMHDKAEVDFRHALDMDPRSVDANYVLGLVLKAQNRTQEAVEYFRRVVDLLEVDQQKDKARIEMLRRLAMGHINELVRGDWNLEEEIWQHQE